MKIEDIRVVHATTKPGEYPPEWTPEIAFLGRSNVGKSTLINSLVNRKKLARTSKAPGRTQAIHWYGVDGTPASCLFVDLPGYGYARVSRRVREEVWAKLIDTYLQSTRPLALAIQLLDIRRDGPTKLDWQMIDWLRANAVNTAYVLTKADKLSRSKQFRARDLFRNQLQAASTPIPYSAVDGSGKDELWSRIDSAVAALLESQPIEDTVNESERESA